MANDALPVSAAISVSAPGAQVPKAATAINNGKSSPVAGRTAAAGGRANEPVDLLSALAQLNKHLENSGRPNHYRLDTSAGRSVIQVINPDSSKVVAEIPASEFKALAQELAVPGLLIDALA